MAEPRRSLLAAVAALALLTSCLAACSGIPTSGPIRSGGAIGVERDNSDDGVVTRVLGQPPREGSTPQQIIEGFLNASAAFDDDHALAREFLTADAAKTWNPSAGATIYDSSTSTGHVSYKNVGLTDVVFSTRWVGSISVQGEFGDATGDYVADFKMRKVDSGTGSPGQWRIASPPAGLLLTLNDVARAYRSYDIYFPDPGRTGLVPNQVFLPIGSAASTSTELMRALVAGPTPWLAPAVQTAIPTGTKLVVDSAPIVDGVVQVDLTAPAATVSAQEAVALSAQVIWTLAALNQVTAVRITVDGVPLRGVKPIQSTDLWAVWGPDAAIPASARAVYAVKDRLLWLDNSQAGHVLGPAGDGTISLHEPGVSFNETEVAGLDAARHKLYVTRLDGSGKAPAPAVTGTRLTAPTWDRIGGGGGNVWTVDQRATESVVWVVPPGAAAEKVQAADLPSGKVQVMRISRDGARVVVVVQPTGQKVGQVYLGRVERGAGKLALSGFKLIKTQLSDITDVAWDSADQLLLLGRTAIGATLQPLIVDLMGGTVRALGPIDPSSVSTQSIVSITDAPGHEALASTSDGHLYRYLANGWQALVDGNDPAYPG